MKIYEVHNTGCNNSSYLYSCIQNVVNHFESAGIPVVLDFDGPIATAKDFLTGDTVGKVTKREVL